MSENRELNVEELNEAAGGYRKPANVPGYTIYQIKKGDTLSKIAKKYKTTQKDIMTWNPKITNKNLIYAGDYLYIKL